MNLENLKPQDMQEPPDGPQDVEPDQEIEDRRRGWRERQQRHRNREAAAADSRSWSPLSDDVPSERETFEILERIQDHHVRKVVYRQGLVAADALDLTPNRYFWKNGLQKTLKAIEELRELKKGFEFAAAEIKAGRAKPEEKIDGQVS